MASPYPESFLLGLIGAPIAHSASPAMHEAAAEALGLRCFYHLIEVAGADADRLRVMLDGVRALGFAGVNVTYPYKEVILPLLDDVAPSAADVGAVNTILACEGRLAGFNTDCSGFAKAVRRAIGDVAGQTIALIGAGGVGKAIGAALSLSGAGEIRIVDRQPAKARALAESLAAGAGRRRAPPSRRRSTARRVSSTPPQSACRPAARRPRRSRFCAAIFGSPTRSISRCGLRCSALRATAAPR